MNPIYRFWLTFGDEEPEVIEDEVSPAIHAAFEKFQTIDMAFGRAVVPGKKQNHLSSLARTFVFQVQEILLIRYIFLLGCLWEREIQ